MTMGALCEAAVAEAACGNVCVYHDNNGRNIVVSNNVYPTLDVVNHPTEDAPKWDAINAAWRKITTVAGVVGVEVEEAEKATGGWCSLIRIAVALASEDLKRACTNGYPTPKRAASEASDEVTVRDYFHGVIASLEKYGGAEVTIRDIAETRTGEPFFVKHCGLPVAEATHIWGVVLAACSAKRPAGDAEAEAPPAKRSAGHTRERVGAGLPHTTQ